MGGGSLEAIDIRSIVADLGFLCHWLKHSFRGLSRPSDVHAVAMSAFLPAFLVA